jgi:hypothetical protein
MITTRLIPLFVLAALIATPLAGAAAQLRVTPINERLILIQTPRGNLVAVVGAEGAVLAGAVDTASTAAVAETLSARTTSPRRYVIAMFGEASRGQFDAGWDRHGALVTMQENAVRRMREPGSPPLRRPRGEFSQFFSLDFNGEAMHAVHQQPGYSNADVLVHFENSNVIYLGESYPGDGYPRIDSALGGTVDGMLATLAPWTRDGTARYVGARGELARGADIRAFRDMVTAVRERVRQLKQAGRSMTDVVAARPAAEFDARYGRGLVSADEFVRDVYRSLR